MARSLVVYTTMYGDYERLLDQTVAQDDDTPFVCFTDRADLQSETWEIRHWPGPFPSDPGRNSRRAKILAHQYVPEFETSLYIDNCVELLARPVDIVEKLLPDDAAMAQLGHAFRESLDDEFAAVIEGGRETHWRLCEQYRHYLAEEPQLLSSPLTVTGILVRRHHDPELKAAMEMWWEHVLRYSRRDQLSIDLVAARSNVVRAVHELDIRGSEFHCWPRTDRERDQAMAKVDARNPHSDCRLWGGLEQPESIPDPEVSILRSENEALRERLAKVRAARDQAQSEVRRLRNSTSWRFTGPLRRISVLASALLCLSRDSRGTRRSSGRSAASNPPRRKNGGAHDPTVGAGLFRGRQRVRTGSAPQSSASRSRPFRPR